jgi:hypothetical protein
MWLLPCRAFAAAALRGASGKPLGVLRGCGVVGNVAVGVSARVAVPVGLVAVRPGPAAAPPVPVAPEVGLVALPAGLAGVPAAPVAVPVSPLVVVAEPAA